MSPGAGLPAGSSRVPGNARPLSTGTPQQESPRGKPTLLEAVEFTVLLGGPHSPAAPAGPGARRALQRLDPAGSGPVPSRRARPDGGPRPAAPGFHLRYALSAPGLELSNCDELICSQLYPKMLHRFAPKFQASACGQRGPSPAVTCASARPPHLSHRGTRLRASPSFSRKRCGPAFSLFQGPASLLGGAPAVTLSTWTRSHGCAPVLSLQPHSPTL